MGEFAASIDPDKDRFGTGLTGKGSKLQGLQAKLQKATDSFNLQKNALPDLFDTLAAHNKALLKQAEKHIKISLDSAKEIAKNDIRIDDLQRLVDQMLQDGRN